MRPKRSAATWSELNSIAEKVKLGINTDTDVNVDLTLKRLGSEIGWLKLHSADGKTNPDKVINEIFGKLDETISGAKDFDKDFRKHMTFMNHDITYPTGLGLALRLKARGTAAVRVKFDGKIDLPAIVKNPKDTDFRLQLIPSAAVDVRGEVAVDGIAVETGVRVSLNMHTSTGTDLIVRLLEGHGVDVKVGLPVNKQEIISVKTDINTIIKEDGKPETLKPVSFDVKRESYDGCFDQVAEIIGLTFCGKVSVPWEGSRSITPAYGPSELSLSVEKADETLNQYHFRIYQLIKEGKANFEVLYDTPGSKEDRKIAVTLDAAMKPKKYVKLNIYSPWTQAVLDGSVVENDNEISAVAKLDHDGAEYLLKAGAKKTKNGKQLKLEPIFEYKAPETKQLLIGRRTGPKGQQQAFSATGVILVDIEDQPYSRKWTIQGLSINTPKGNLVLDGKGSLSEHGIDGENKLTFGEDSVQINGHALNDGKTASLKLAVSPSQYKDVSFEVLLSQTKEGDIGNKLNYENKLVITHGPDPNTKESKISLINKFNRDAKASSLSLSSQATYPLFQVDGSVSLDIKPKSVSANVKAQADKYNGGLRVKAEIDSKKPGDYNIEIGADAMSNSVSLSATRKVIKPTQSKFTNVLEIKPGGKYELGATVTHNIGNDIDVQIDAEAKLPQEPKVLNIKTGLKSTKSEFKGNLKASAGGKVYVDADAHSKKSEKPSGGYKLKLLGYVDSNGDFSYDGSNLKAKAKLDLLKSDRKANGKADLVVKDQKVSGLIDLCWDTKNPSKSLKIQTDSARLSGDTQGITSKNTITFDSAKTILNGKYLINGKEIKSGKVPHKGSDSGEIEIVLPSGYKVVGKGSDSWDLEGGQAESVYGLTLQEPGKGPRDMSLKIVGKNFDADPIKFDTQVTLSYVNPDKKDAILHASAKKVPKDGGKKWTVKGEIGSSGSLIDKPLTVKLDSDVSDKLLDGEWIEDKTIPPVNYKFSLTLGSDLSLESNGKAAGTTVAGDLSAKLPEGSTVKSLKYSTTNIIDIIPGKDKHNKLKTSQSLQWNEDKFIKAELEGICEDNGLRYSAEWETNALAKRKLTGAAHLNSKEGLKADASANLAWEGKTADLNAKFDSNKDGSLVGAHATAITPDHGKSDLAFKNKIIKEGKGWETDLSLASGDKKIAATSKIELDKEHPLVDINVDHPNGQSKLYFKNDKKGEKHWITEMKAKWSNNGGVISVRNEADLGSIDNLSIKSNLELPEHKKVDVDVNVKDGKKVSFSVKKDDKPYVSGNANYERKIEGKTKTVSGKGEVDIEGKSYPLSYLATYEELVEGDKFVFNIDAGSRKASVNILRTPDEFLWERTYCKEAGKCSKAFIKSKISKISVEEFEQSSSAQIDFSIINPKYHDVSYKSTYKRNGLIQDQNIELQWSAAEKIKYNAYVHEKQAGVILALPKRTVGAELQYSGAKKGNMKVEADLWLNKEKNDKLCFIATMDVTKSNDNNIISGETKLSHPALKKDLLIKGKASINDKLGKLEGDVVIDIFRKPNQKIIMAFKSGRNFEGKSYTLHRSGSIKSEGCNLDIGYESRAVVKTDEMVATWSESVSYKDSTGAKREASASFEGSPKKIVAKVKAPEGILGEVDINVDSKQKK
uniref:Vitellinogen open beta-sheet domain-containing protein n=1 Tax=Lygus hesperus TaxID=30085 RepID=A0A0A9YRM2_LYGHE